MLVVYFDQLLGAAHTQKQGYSQGYCFSQLLGAWIWVLFYMSSKVTDKFIMFIIVIFYKFFCKFSPFSVFPISTSCSSHIIFILVPNMLLCSIVLIGAIFSPTRHIQYPGLGLSFFV